MSHLLLKFVCKRKGLFLEQWQLLVCQSAMWTGCTGVSWGEGQSLCRCGIADAAGTDCRSPLWESQRICVGPPYFAWCDLSLEKQRRTLWGGEGKYNVTAGFTEVVFISLKIDNPTQANPFCLFARWKLASWHLAFSCMP